jgi:hypothetical protein
MTLLREPLVHFLVIGAALFAGWAAFGDNVDAASRRIVVSEAHVVQLATGFERTWLRPPTREELESLIREFVREEVLYREAVALGLDRDDTIIRRRLRQKMEFISDDVAAADMPTEADLLAYLQEHAASYRPDPVLAFRHVYISRDRHGPEAGRVADRLLTTLRSTPPPDAETLGDPLMLPHFFAPTPRAEVAQLFGEAFADRVTAAPLDRWDGPYESGYGLHLVRLEQRVDASAPTLADVRERVEQDWRDDRRRRANEAGYQELLAQYVVTVDVPEFAAAVGRR